MRNLRLFAVLLSIMMADVMMAQTEKTLWEAYRDYWYTGVSVNQWEVEGEQSADWDVITKNFNWVVAENCMKCEVVHPKEGVYDFTLADQFVNKAKAAGLKVLGHCLIWHSQCAPWFHYDDEGNLVSAEVLKQRMREHIYTIVSHFKGRVDAWDVVNEAFEDDGTPRQSLFYQILGTDYIPLAFQYAHEADPSIELYYNDFSMNKAQKVEGVANFFRPLIQQGLPVTAIGMQGHMVLEDNNYIQEYEHAINTITSLGVPTFFSEVDLTVLPNPYGFSGANISDRFAYRPEMDPYKNGLSKEKEAEIEQFWLSFYQMLLRHHKDILRVNFWCLNDGISWRNDFPINGRTDYATLFDRQNNPKPFVQALINLANKLLTLKHQNIMKQKLCQSCGMPLTEEIMGTNADGSRNEDYCVYCYKNGAFTQDCTMEQMIDFCAQFTDQMNKQAGWNLTPEQAKEQMRKYFPQLKRWKNKD